MSKYRSMFWYNSELENQYCIRTHYSKEDFLAYMKREQSIRDDVTFHSFATVPSWILNSLWRDDWEHEKEIVDN